MWWKQFLCYHFFCFAPESSGGLPSKEGKVKCIYIKKRVKIIWSIKENVKDRESREEDGEVIEKLPFNRGLEISTQNLKKSSVRFPSVLLIKRFSCDWNYSRRDREAMNRRWNKSTNVF